MKLYTVKELSRLANVSVRTLHYYDEIGLLRPKMRSESGYRHYGEDELLKLQQILFFRELEFPLEEIRDVLNKPDFNLKQSLQFHRQKILEKTKQFKVLLKTIDKTLDKLNHKTTMTDEQLYKGFATKADPTGVKTGKAYAQEAAQKWDPKIVKASQQKIKNMDPIEWKKIQEEGEEISQKLASLMHLDPADTAVQQTIASHFEHMKHFWPVTKDKYVYLGRMYVQDERFKTHYEKYSKGLAQFIRDAIEVFCKE